MYFVVERKFWLVWLPVYVAGTYYEAATKMCQMSGTLRMGVLGQKKRLLKEEVNFWTTRF